MSIKHPLFKNRLRHEINRHHFCKDPMDMPAQALTRLVQKHVPPPCCYEHCYSQKRMCIILMTIHDVIFERLPYILNHNLPWTVVMTFAKFGIICR